MFGAAPYPSVLVVVPEVPRLGRTDAPAAAPALDLSRCYSRCPALALGVMLRPVAALLLGAALSFDFLAALGAAP